MTNPTISAEERAKRAVGLWKDARGVDNVIPWEDNLLANATEQFRQAEQAAYERGLKEGRTDAAIILQNAVNALSDATRTARALAQQPEEVG